MKKKLVTIMLSVASIFVLAFPVFAASVPFTTPSTDWWAPNSGKVDMTYSDVIELNINNCYYSSDRIAKIREKYIDNIGIGLDQHDYYQNHLTANASRNTNYPNPYFDREDDGTDGYYDESEVGCKTPSLLSSSSRYYFWQDWAKFTDTGTGRLTNNAIASVMGVEWQTYAYTSLAILDYNCSEITPPEYALSNQTIAQGSTDAADYKVSQKSNYYKVKYLPRFEDPEVLDKYVDDNKKLLSELNSQNRVVPVNITFNQPLTQERVQEIANKYDIFTDFVGGRAINDNNEKVTTELDINGTEISLSRTLDTLKKCDPSAKFKGVIYLRGTVNTERLAELSAEPDVYLADVNYEYIAEKYRKELKMKNSDMIKVFISSPYWDIEKDNEV